jgi:hypothetical protein
VISPEPALNPVLWAIRFLPSIDHRYLHSLETSRWREKITAPRIRTPARRVLPCHWPRHWHAALPHHGLSALPASVWLRGRFSAVPLQPPTVRSDSCHRAKHSPGAVPTAKPNQTEEPSGNVRRTGSPVSPRRSRRPLPCAKKHALALSHHRGMDCDIAQGMQTVGVHPRPPLGLGPASPRFDPCRAIGNSTHGPAIQANLGRSAINVAGSCIFRDTG